MDSAVSKKIKSFLQSPYSLAFPVAFMVILALPSIFSRYRSELIESGMVDKKGGFEYFEDIDHDGNSERIVVFNNTEGKASIKIINHDGFIRGHYYFRGKMLPSREAFTSGPIDRSGRVALFLIILRNDSLLLNGVMPLADRQYLFKDVFIAGIAGNNGRFDYSINNIILYDADHDGTKEVISSIVAGFPLQPRLTFIYDINNGVVSRSPFMGSYFLISDTADINHDGRGDLLTHSYAIDNYPDTVQSVPFGDHSAWLMAFDYRMNFLFPPQQYSGTYVSLTTKAFLGCGKTYIAALRYARARGSGFPQLMLFDSAGTLVRSRIIDDTSQLRHYSLYIPLPGRNRLWLIREDGKAEEFDQNLETIRTIPASAKTSVGYTPVDIDLDGTSELLFNFNSQVNPVVMRADFSEPVELVLPSANMPRYVAVKKEKGKPGRLFIQQGDAYWLFSYEKNPWYYLQFPVYLSVYMLILGFIMLVQYLQRRTFRQKYDAEKKIAGLQLLLLKSQLDPHFTFNAINAISASILQESPENANRNLMQLARLMRSCVLQSDKLSWSLAEELEFMQNYVSLIRSRMNGSFEFRLEISPAVDVEVHVPRMITQIYVENAIKHGLKPMDHGGILVVRVNHGEGGLHFEIEDNGIGRRRSAVTGEHGTGKGMSIMDQTIAIFNKYNQKKIVKEVVDMEDGQGNGKGTLVRLMVPFGMKYGFFGG